MRILLDVYLKAPKEWIVTTLGTIYDIVTGNPAPQGEEFFEDGTFPFVRVQDMGRLGEEIYLTKTNDLVNYKAIRKLKLFPRGSILFTKSGASTLNNQRAILGQDSYVVSHIAAILPGYGIPNKFVYFYLKCVDFSELAHSTIMPSLPISKVKSLQFLLPPTNEQHRIVAKIETLFSELDKGIDSLKTAREQLKVYRQALLKHAFSGKLTAQWRTENPDKLETAEILLQRIQAERQQHYQQQLEDWEISGKQGSKPKAPKALPPLTTEELAELPELPKGWGYFLIGDVCLESILGKMLDKIKNKGELKPYLRNVNVRWGKFALDNLLEMKFEESEYIRYGLKDGDLVICEGGEPGRCAVWQKEFGQSMQIQKALHRIRFTGSINSTFVQMYFELCASNRRLEKMFTGTTIKHLTGEKLARMVIPICSIDEQTHILITLELKFSIIDQLDQTITTALQQSEALRQSILKKAFSGQLVPQDPNDEPASVLLERIQAEKAALLTRAKTVTQTPNQQGKFSI